MTDNDDDHDDNDEKRTKIDRLALTGAIYRPRVAMATRGLYIAGLGAPRTRTRAEAKLDGWFKGVMERERGLLRLDSVGRFQGVGLLQKAEPGGGSGSRRRSRRTRDDGQSVSQVVIDLSSRSDVYISRTYFEQQQRGSHESG